MILMKLISLSLQLIFFVNMSVMKKSKLKMKSNHKMLKAKNNHNQLKSKSYHKKKVGERKLLM